MRQSRHGRRSTARPKRPRERPESAGAHELSPAERHEQLLARMNQAARFCQTIREQLRQEPGPELETILQLHRLLVLKLSADAQAAPELLRLVQTLMRPLMDWARLEESRKLRALAEQKYRDSLAAQQAARDKDRQGAQALRPETLEKIERELKLF